MFQRQVWCYLMSQACHQHISTGLLLSYPHISGKNEDIAGDPQSTGMVEPA